MPENEPKRQENKSLQVKTVEIPPSYGFSQQLNKIEYENLRAAFKETTKNISATLLRVDPKVIIPFMNKLSNFKQLNQIDQQVSDKDTFQQFMSMASQTMIADIFDKAKQIGQHYHLPSDFFKMVELVKLDYLYCLDIKYGKFSLLDLYRNRVSSLSDRLRLLIDPVIIYENPEDEKALTLFRRVCQENMNNVNSAYPNMCINETYLSLLLTVNLCLLKKRVECLPAANSFQKEACATFNSVYDRVRQTREEFYQILMDPDHPKYQELMSFFLDNYSNYTTDFLDTCLVFSIPNLQKTFRRAKELAKNSPHPDIYALIRDTLSDVSVLRKGGGIPIPVAEMDQILDFEKTKLSEIPEPKMTEIGQKINGINSLPCTLRLKDKIFSLTTDEVGTDWGFINLPEVVNLALDKNNPYTKFALSFEWSNKETKESFSFTCIFDTKRRLFEWSFLEDPDDPDFQFVKGQILRTVASALDQITDELKALPKEKSNYTPKENGQNLPTSVKTEKIHFHDEVYDIRKSKSEANGLDESESMLAHDLKKEIRESRLFLKKIKICEPKFWQEENLFKGLSENEITNLKKAIHDYNETGTGSMVKMLSREKSFRLKVGKYRIIFDVIETPLGDKLIPVSAQHRREVYRQY